MNVAKLAISDAKIAESRILLIDDDEINCLIIKDFLSGLCKVSYITTFADIFAECDRFQPDLILLDIFMGEKSGLEICKRLKSKAGYSELPVIFVTSSAHYEELEECWQAGCVDFITKPVNFTTLTNRVKVHLCLKYQAEMLREQSYKDGLTGLYNRSYLSHIFPMYFAQCQRDSLPLSLMIIDIDWFKQFNDLYGHVHGDTCIRQVSHLIQEHIRRPMDLAFRYGGEEFLCLFPNTDRDGVALIANNIVAQVAERAIPHAHSDFGTVTVSIGAYTHSEEKLLTLAALTDCADKALYRAKQSGRNQVNINDLSLS